MNLLLINVLADGLKGAAISFSLVNLLVFLINEVVIDKYHYKHTEGYKFKLFSKTFWNTNKSSFNSVAYSTLFQNLNI